MSKFFTHPPALLLASVCLTLASEDVKPSAMPPPARPIPGGPTLSGTGLPAPLSTGRFAALGKKSPFTLASTTEENADFAKDLILAGYFRMDGKDFVLVANRTQPTRLMVGTQPSAGAQGLTLVKVERDPSGDPTKMRAQIRIGAEMATLKYEAAASVGQPVPGQATPGQPQIPGQPQAAQGAPAVPGQTPVQNPPVIRRRVIPIPPAPSR